jgi:hypothetical protein
MYKSQIPSTFSSFYGTSRMDTKGESIRKGGKHHVTFSPTLTEIIEVENWKIHNVHTEEEE